MRRGKTERETLELNGWSIGDVLEGDEGYGPHLIKITAIGEELFFAGGITAKETDGSPSPGKPRYLAGSGKR